MRKLTIAPLLALPFLACGGDDGNSKVVVKSDAGKTADAAGSATGSCESADSYSSFLAGSGNGPFVKDYPASGSAAHEQLVYGAIARNSAGSADVVAEFDFQDGSGSGIFPSGIVTGTYTIDSNTPALPFWVLLPNYQQSGSSQAEFSSYVDQHAYWTVAGTLVLTAEGGSGQTVSGSFTNMEMVHYIASGSTLTPADDDGSGNPCVTTISNLAFSATATMGTAKQLTDIHWIGIDGVHTGISYTATNRLANRHY